MSRALPDHRLAGLWKDAGGLDEHDVRARRARYGENRILEARRHRWLGLAADTATDPMVWFLLGVALLFAWIGDWDEAAILAAALAPIAGMDAYLHWRTQASTEGLSKRLAARARVIRGGRRIDIPASELVVGDLVEVEAGAWFPADGLVETGSDLQVDESSLTGEAMPVHKHALAADTAPGAGMPLPDAAWVSAGSRLLTGSARCRIAFTGAETVYGQIARSVQDSRRDRTPLQKAIGGLVRQLLVAALVACLALGLIRLLQGHGLVDAIVTAATLGIAALPEEIPVVFTFFLGVGVFRLARRRALVRRAVAVENIGRVTCICSDKTGTLTEGRLTLAHVIPAVDQAASDLLRTAALASRSESHDPLDQAILAEAQPGAGARLATFPFTEDRRKEAAVVRSEAGVTIAVKGAPETVMALCGLDPAVRHDWLKRTEELAASAHRVIACAVRRQPDWEGAEPESGYEFLGLLAFEDPLRPAAAGAVAAAQAAGIRVIMITGDHVGTARAVASRLGLGGREAIVIEGSQLAERLAASDSGHLGFDVVARAAPAHKLALVERLRAAGEVVAVTGDGVNDAPALRVADIGVAMGARGAQTARDVAAIVLLDDDFRTLVSAIQEGRQLFRNLQLSFAYLLMVHAPLVLGAAVVPAMGEPLLLLPSHIVWLELIIHPTALLVFQQHAGDAKLARVQGHGRPRFFGRREVAVIALAATAGTVLVLVAYQIGLSGQSATYARAAALAALVLSLAAVVVGLTRLRSRAALVATAATIASAILIIQLPVLARLAHLTPIDATHWALAAIGSVVVGAMAWLFGASPRPATQAAGA